MYGQGRKIGKPTNSTVFWEGGNKPKGLTVKSYCERYVFILQIVLSGNIEDVFHTKKMVLEFHLFRDENYRVFNVCAIDKHNKAEGRIKIQLTSYKSTVEIVGGEHADCFACRNSRRRTC
jgi:hypothetical protein